jgi:hypothetical protein
MFTTKVKIEDRTKAVKAASDKAAFRNFGHAAASIRKDVAASIEVSPDPAPPGQPPHTRPQRGLPRSLRFDVDKEGAVIGPTLSRAGKAAAVQEFGGRYKGQEFPERPYMLPGLERNIPRFAGSWEGSIGQ